MSYFVEIDFPSSGIKKFGEISVQTSTGNVLKYIKSVSEISRAINKNKSFENSTATIIFHNINGYFDKIMKDDDRYIKGVIVRIYDNDILIFTGKIYDTPKCNVNEFAIIADSKTFGLDKIINRKIKKKDFSNAPNINVGKYSNIIFGFASDSGENNSGILTAYKIDTNKYLAAWHELKGFENPYTGTDVFDKDGNNITNVCSFLNQDGKAYIVYSSTENEIYFNANGFVKDSSLIENPAEQLEELNNIFGLFTFDGITDAANVYNSRKYSGSCIIINDNIKWETFFKNFAVNFDCFLFQKVNGNLGIKVLDWGTETPNHTIKEMYVDQNTFSNRRDMSKIINEYQRMYWYHFRKNFFHRLPSDVTASTKWISEPETLDLRYHRDEVTAMDVTARLIFFKKVPIIYYIIPIPKNIGNKIELGDVINFKYKKGFFPYTYRLTIVLRKNYTQSKEFVFIEGMDITGINENLIRLWRDDDKDIIRLIDESEQNCHALL
jgi:hypothetical protein